MTLRWLLPDRLFDGHNLMSDMAVGILKGRVAEIRPATGIAGRRVAGTLTPGFVDLQVNGGGGVMMNTDPQGLSKIRQAHRGTVALLPTVITDAPDVMRHAVDAVLAQADPAILGLHIEGPHIAPSRRGTHALRHIRALDDQTFAQVARLLTAGLVAKITLAPEAVIAGQVRRLVDMGAVVSIGHSDASAAQANALLTEGATAFTHLFNAMSPMTGRAAGVTGAAILSQAYCGVICDGHHLADDMIRLALAARPTADRMFLVSDAMATVGGPDHFDLYGQRISLQDGRLINAEGALAGAHLTMARALRRMIGTVGVPPQMALRMAISNPARLINRFDLFEIKNRSVGDLMVLNTDWKVTDAVI